VACGPELLREKRRKKEKGDEGPWLEKKRSRGEVGEESFALDAGHSDQKLKGLNLGRGSWGDEILRGEKVGLQET